MARHLRTKRNPGVTTPFAKGACSSASYRIGVNVTRIEDSRVVSPTIHWVNDSQASE
jgi:hypothetical protein